MKCDKCKTAEANFHSVTNINGKISEKHLCEKCARGEREFNSLKDNFLDFDSHRSFFDDMMSDFKTTLSYFTSPRLSSFFDDDFFKDEINLIESEENSENKRSLQKEENKRKLSEEEKQQIELNKLNIQLKKAVVEERYEDAIKLRDKIKEIKKTQKN